MSIKPNLAFVNLLIVAGAHNIFLGKPAAPADQHSVSSRQVTELEACGNKDQFFVCDPDLVLTQQEKDQLLRFLKSLEVETRNPFGKTECERKGLTVGVAISKTKISPEEEKQPAAASSQGHDWNEHNHHSHNELNGKNEDQKEDDKLDDKDSESVSDVKMDHHLHIPYLPPIPPPSDQSPNFSGSTNSSSKQPALSPDLAPCFVTGELSLTQLLNHQSNNNNRFARELIRGWGLDNETCSEKSAIILLSPINPLPDSESKDLACFYADKTNFFRQKRYLDGLLEMLEEQRLIYLDAKLYSAIETCRSLALPEAAPFSPPVLASSSTEPSYNKSSSTSSHNSTSPPSKISNSQFSSSNNSKYQPPKEQNFAKFTQLEAEQWQRQQPKAQLMQCSYSHTTNTLLILLFLTITSQTLLLVAIIVLKMRGFFNKPAGAVVPAVAPVTTVTSPPPMYNLKPMLSPPSFFDHLDDKKNMTYKR